MEKLLTHEAPHQRTRDRIDCTAVTLALHYTVGLYDACCDSGVLGRFRQAPAHLHGCACAGIGLPGNTCTIDIYMLM